MTSQELNDYFNKNLDEMKRAKRASEEFLFDDDAIQTLYKICFKAAVDKKLNIDDKEDAVQYAMTRFCTYSIYKYNPNQNILFSTFAYVCLNNFLLRYIDYINAELKTISIDNPDFETPLRPTLKSKFLTPLEYCVNKEYKNFILGRLKKYDILRKYYFKNKQLKDIAKEKGVSTQRIGQKIQDQKNKLKKDLKNAGIEKV